MQFDLLDNGIDSLKATGDILLEHYLDYEFKRHQIKDALFHFVHGVEVLSKYLLKNDSESRIFKDHKKYREALKKMRKESLSSVFEANPYLETITLSSALNKLKYDKSLTMDELLWDSLNQLRLFRNEMMHYTVELDDDEFHVFVMEFRRTYNKTFFYFEKHIPNFKDKVNSVEREEGFTEYDKYLDQMEVMGMMAYETQLLDAEVDYYEALEENHK